MSDSIFTPPNIDELEISIFGPGYGECVLMHTGDNEWIVVDSCILPESNEPAILNYLSKINVDPTHSIKQILVSHWHDDHTRGLKRIVDVAKNAELLISSALLSKEFYQLASLYGTRPMMESSGADELYHVLKIIKQRKKESKGLFHPLLVSENKRVFYKKHDDNRIVEIYTLSPSSASIVVAYAKFCELIPGIMETKKRLLPISPNSTSVVLWCSVGKNCILLGSDLEVSKNRNIGWSAILRSSARPQGKASIYKIPHHGSKNADHDNIWQELLNKEPIVVLTPKGVQLPTEGDIKRINSRTSRAYSTAKKIEKKVKVSLNVVEKQIKQSTKYIKRVQGSFGQVRIRGSICENNSEKNSWKIDLIGDAVELDKLSNI